MAKSEDAEPVGIISLEESLAGVEQPENLPAGKYIGEVIDVQTPTSDKGNRYFSIQIIIPPEEFPSTFDSDNAPDGVTLYWNRTIVPRGGKDRRALWNLKRLLLALGKDPDTTEIDVNEWMGVKVVCRTRISRWQGEERAEIMALEAADTPAPKAAAKGGGRRGK